MVSTQQTAHGGAEESPLSPYSAGREITVVIPCYFVNDELVEMTVGCVNSLIETALDDLNQILIIDDGSPIELNLVDEINFVSKITVLRKENNGGYSSASNMGLFHADGDIIVLGNNDITFTEGWLDGLLGVLDEGYDIATCWTSDQDVKFEDRIEENAKFGSLWAMKRSVYETVGPFDEQFRGYFTDLDYRHRALDAGFKIGKNLNCVVEHLAKATYEQTDPNDDEYLKAMRLYEIKYGAVE